MENHESLTASQVGLRESRQLGWCNTQTSELVPGVEILPQMRVVDLGCGHGGYIDFCARQGANVTFIDRQENHVLAIEKRLANLEGVEAKGIVSDCNPIPLEDNYAELVICTEVLEHVADPDALMKEMVRIAKPGATFLLAVPDARSENLVREVAPPNYFKEPYHIRVFDSRKFEALVIQHGLEIERHDYKGGFWSVFFLFKWVTSQPGEALNEDVHPITRLWTRTWAEVLKHPDGDKIYQALNAALPKSQVIVARKPEDDIIS